MYAECGGIMADKADGCRWWVTLGGGCGAGEQILVTWARRPRDGGCHVTWKTGA